MIRLLLTVPYVVALTGLLYFSYQSLVVSTALAGASGELSRVAAILITALVATGVYALRDAIWRLGADKRRRLILAFVAAAFPWPAMLSKVQEGTGDVVTPLVAMFICGLVAEASLMSLLLFALRVVAARWRGAEPMPNTRTS